MNEFQISDLIYERLNYMYCDNCRYDSEIPGEWCEDCHRKNNGWAISRQEADNIAALICEND